MADAITVSQVQPVQSALRFLRVIPGVLVGLRTNFSEMRKQGLRPFAVGAIGEVVIAVFMLALVYGASKIFGW